MAKFKVGDAVRVKADAQRVARAGKCAAYGHSFGNKLTILRSRGGDLQGHWVFSNPTGTDYCHENYLEPWNDAEEWNGTAWVAKKPADSPKPAIVCLREEGKLNFGIRSTECKSTNAAFALAETWANDSPGKEYVVLQEKGSRRVEKPKTNADRFEERCMSDASSRESFNLLDGNDAVVATGRTIGVIRDGERIVVTYDVSGF